MKVFVSYDRDDQRHCDRIVRTLHDHGCVVLYDRDIVPGDQWWRSIEQQIQDCDCFLALLSADSVASAHCKREWNMATRLRARTGRPHVVPWKLARTVAIPTIFARTHAQMADDGLPEVIRKVRQQLLQQIHEFWGEEAFRQPVRLVVATRELRGGRWKTHAAVPMQHKAKPEGPRHWLAAQDVRAAVHLTNAVSQFSGHGIEVLHDCEIQLRRDVHCTVALGLGFNQLTFDLMNSVPGLYRIEFDESRVGNLACTDYFALGGERRIRPRKGWDAALLARVVLPRSNGRRSIHFVCAGRTAHGTASAGYFLAERWPELLNLYRKRKLVLDADSVAAVLWHRTAQDGQLEDDTQGELKSPAGQVLFKYERASGLPTRARARVQRGDASRRPRRHEKRHAVD